MNANIPLWKSLYVDPKLKRPISRGLVVDIHRRDFYKGPRQLLVTFDPLLLQSALDEPSNIVIKSLKLVPEVGPNDLELASIGLQFLDPGTIPDQKIREFWSLECSKLEGKKRRGVEG